MPLLDIHHVAIKTQDLEATDRFYEEVLGLEKIDRPDFDFPGTWFDLGSTMFHIMAGDAGLDNDGNPTHGSASVDHVAVKAHDFDTMKKTVVDLDMPHREFAIPTFGLWQLFVREPERGDHRAQLHRRRRARGKPGPGHRQPVRPRRVLISAQAPGRGGR